MSEYKSEINKGAIFVNDRKGNEKAPIKTGKFVDENGVEKRIAIWENISKKGLKYESFIISDVVEYVKEALDEVGTDTEPNVLPLEEVGTDTEPNVLPF